MEIYDLFSGIGGFSEAARRVGWSTAGICEIDKHAIKIYNKNFGTNHTPTDVRKLNTNELPDFEILTAGFPCPSFSTAGKRQGFQDERGNLFFEIPKILRDKRPEMFLFENVEGILSSGSYLKTGIFKATKGKTKGELTDDFQRVKDESRRGWTEITIPISGGETLLRIFETLEKCGYSFQWQVLNSKYQGVAQNRERIFIYGVRGGCPQKIFPLGEDVQAVDEVSEQNTNTITARYAAGQANGSYIIENKQEEIKVFDAYNSSVVDCPGAVRSNMSNAGPLVVLPKLAGCLTDGGHSGGLHSQMTAIPVLTPFRENKRQVGRRFKTDGEPAFTLTSQDVHGVLTENYLNIATYIRSYANACKTNAREILFFLRKEIISSETKEWAYDEFTSFWENEILQQDMYEKVFQEALEGGCSSSRRKLSGEADSKFKSLCEVWQRRKDGYSPQRQKQIEQLLEQFRSHLSFLSYERTPSKTKLQDMWQADERVRLLRQALPKIQKIWESIDVQTEPIPPAYRIRRLVPEECEVLQSFPRGWTEGVSDSQRYRLLGNSITVNVAETIFRELQKGI